MFELGLAICLSFRYNTLCYHAEVRIIMDRSFSQTLSALRRQRNLSQRAVAADLGISQALLSHYENGAREPGLQFVCRACDYYGVTADYLLCRSAHPGDVSIKGSRAFLAEVRSILDRAENALNEIGGEQL